jgi:hypothetical protein
MYVIHASLSRSLFLSLSATHPPTPTHLNSVTRVEDKTVHMRAFRLLWRSQISRELPFYPCFFLKKSVSQTLCVSVSVCFPSPPHPSLRLNSQTDRQAGRQTDRQTVRDRQTDTREHRVPRRDAKAAGIEGHHFLLPIRAVCPHYTLDLKL